MKPYYNEGLLPDEYVEEAFKRLLTIKKGTVGEAFLKVAKEMSLEYHQLGTHHPDPAFSIQAYLYISFSHHLLLCNKKAPYSLGCFSFSFNSYSSFSQSIEVSNNSLFFSFSGISI